MPEWMERFRKRNRARNWVLAGCGYAALAVLGGMGLSSYTQAGMSQIHPASTMTAAASEATVPPLVVTSVQAAVYRDPGPDPDASMDEASYQRVGN